MANLINPNYNMKFMNFSHANPFLETFSASFEHDADDAVTPPPPQPPTAFALGHRKKFLDPNSISFSSLSKPGPTDNYHNQYAPDTCQSIAYETKSGTLIL